MKLKSILLFCVCSYITNICLGEERQGLVTLKVNVNSSKAVQSSKIWIPYPLSNPYQTIENMHIKGNFINSAVYKEPVSGALYLFAEWALSTEEQKLELAFKAKAKAREITPLVDRGEPVPVEIKKYLQADWWMPTDGPVAIIANDIKKDKTGILEKARAVYDWVVENTSRDTNVKGCGLGIVEVTLAKRSGKCADISSVYVALARNIGVPAREVFGIRLGKKAEQDITGDYHCWAEFYLPGTGWIPVDPADVRKKMLVEHLKLEDVKEFRAYSFGAVDQYRIVLERGGRGISFIDSQTGTKALNYFMYPYAEVNGQALDYFDPKSFRYSVHFKQI